MNRSACLRANLQLICVKENTENLDGAERDTVLEGPGVLLHLTACVGTRLKQCSHD